MQKGHIFKKNSSLLQNMWKKLNAGYDDHAGSLLPKFVKIMALG